MPPLPSGWTGFYSLFDSPDAGSAPACGSDFPTQAFAGNGQLNAPDATCSACFCSAPQSPTCGLADANTMLLISDATCTGSPNCGANLSAPTSTWNGSCYGPDGLQGGQNTCGANSNCVSGSGPCNVSISTPALVVTSGGCSASQQSPTVPTPAWAEVAQACGDPTPGTGCTSGDTCLPVPQAPYRTGLCIMQPGNVGSCPAGPFSDLHVFYTGVDDTRSCSACTCGNPSGSCSATISVYSAGTANTCTSLAATLHPTSASGDCANLTGNPTISGRSATFSSVTGAVCPSGGGQPTGAASPSGGTSFCCIP